MSNVLSTILIALIGVLTAGITGFFAFAGKNRENKVNNWDQLNDALMQDRKFWREEASVLRTQLEAKHLEITALRVELTATKDALVYKTKESIDDDAAMGHGGTPWGESIPGTTDTSAT